jgi:hypothetical protein
MEHIIAYADEWGAEARTSGLSYERVRAEVQRKALEHTPIYLGIVEAVTYDSKTDRYVLKFNKSSARCTNDVAEFLLTHGINKPTLPTVYAHMADGTIDQVLLLFISRS